MADDVLDTRILSYLRSCQKMLKNSWRETYEGGGIASKTAALDLLSDISEEVGRVRQAVAGSSVLGSCQCPPGKGDHGWDDMGAPYCYRCHSYWRA